MPKKILNTPSQIVATKASTAKLSYIGSTAQITLFGRQVPAKIDTGADSSAIYASDIKITKDHILKFKLFAPSHPLYTGKVIKRKDFTVAQVKSSNGQAEIRYRANLPITLAGRRIRVTFNLADRSQNQYPILIGRRTLYNKFLIDVSKNAFAKTPNLKSKQLNHQLKRNPRQFYLKQKRGKITV